MNNSLKNFLITWCESFLLVISLFGFGVFYVDDLGGWAYTNITVGLIWFVLSFMAVGTLVALVFHRLDPDRTAKWHAMLHTILAFYTANMIIGYGAAKVFKTQFQPPYFVLDTPIGDLGGFWLTWVYYGHSMTLSYIIGFTQIIGSVLLMFRKTRLLATFILASVMVNICLVNHFYDISPVAYFNSLHYTANLFFLMLLDFEKLKAAFLSFREKISFTSAKFWLLNALRIGIVAFSCYQMYSLRNSFPPITQLNGRWDIQKITQNNITVAPQNHPDSAWHRLYIEWRYGLMFKVSPGKEHKADLHGTYSLDQDSRILQVKFSGQAADTATFHYQFTNDSVMTLSGKRNTDSLIFELKRAR